MKVQIDSPGSELEFESVVRVRFEAADGSRGILPGHESSLSTNVAGILELVSLDIDGGTSTAFVAAEPGIVDIRPDRVRLLTPWAAVDVDTGALLDSLRRRQQERSERQAIARAYLGQHDVAIRNALMKLRKQVER